MSTQEIVLGPVRLNPQDQANQWSKEVHAFIEVHKRSPEGRPPLEELEEALVACDANLVKDRKKGIESGEQRLETWLNRLRKALRKMSPLSPSGATEGQGGSDGEDEEEVVVLPQPGGTEVARERAKEVSAVYGTPASLFGEQAGSPKKVKRSPAKKAGKKRPTATASGDEAVSTTAAQSKPETPTTPRVDRDGLPPASDSDYLLALMVKLSQTDDFGVLLKIKKVITGDKPGPDAAKGELEDHDRATKMIVEKVRKMADAQLASASSPPATQAAETASVPSQPMTQPKTVVVETVSSDGICLGQSEPVVRPGRGYEVYSSAVVATGPLNADPAVINARDRPLAHCYVKSTSSTKSESESLGVVLYCMMHHTLAFMPFVTMLELGAAWLQTREGCDVPLALEMRLKAITNGSSLMDCNFGNCALDFERLQAMLKTQKGGAERGTPLDIQVQADNGARRVLSELVAFWICLYTTELSFTLKEICYTAFHAANPAGADRSLKRREYEHAPMSMVSRITLQRCNEHNFFQHHPDEARCASSCTGRRSAQLHLLEATPEKASERDSHYASPSSPRKQHRQEGPGTRVQREGGETWPQTITVKDRSIALPPRHVVASVLRNCDRKCVYCGSKDHRFDPAKQSSCGGTQLPGYDPRWPTAALWAKVESKY